MPQNRRVYLLDPKKLSPETIAVAFAKTSRSPKAFDEIAAELSDQASADFHEKWVVGYGHSSVAEHAVLHIAVENISRLAVECLESNRLASYTEKSSRYQVWDTDQFYIPDEFSQSPLKELYLATCRDLFGAYQQTFEKVSAYLHAHESRLDGETERGFETRLRSASADVCRYFLPASSLANVGVSINARALEHALKKMLSHPLEEVQTIGKEIKAQALEHVPTLVKYANPNPYLIGLAREKPDFAQFTKGTGGKDDWCSCVDFDRNGEEKILAAFLYRIELCTFEDAFQRVQKMDAHARDQLVCRLFQDCTQHDIPARELEYAQVIFDLKIDQGAYFELKRHRMMTQTVQLFTPHLGYALPSLINKAACAPLFERMMEASNNAYLELAQIDPFAAAYVLPNAFNRRILLQMNLRAALHLIKLRSASNAHFAIRRPALKIAEIIRGRFPQLGAVFTPTTEETWETVENEFFSKTM